MLLKRVREKRSELKSRGNAGFTLMELIIVIAILAMLTALLMPRFANYTDKAMGTTAASDARNILTVAMAANLDNNGIISLDDLKKETGITGVGGKKLESGTGGGAGTAGTTFLYTYERGGAKIAATIDVQNGTISYTVTPTGTGAASTTYPLATGTTAPGADTQTGRIAKGLGF